MLKPWYKQMTIRHHPGWSALVLGQPSIILLMNSHDIISNMGVVATLFSLKHDPKKLNCTAEKSYYAVIEETPS